MGNNNTGKTQYIISDLMGKQFYCKGDCIYKNALYSRTESEVVIAWKDEVGIDGYSLYSIKEVLRYFEDGDWILEEA